MRLMVCQRTKRMIGRHCQKWRHKRQLAADVHVDVDADADVDVGVFTHTFSIELRN